MSWSDFEVPHIFIVKSSKQCINCGIFKQFLEKRSDQFYSICGLEDAERTVC